MDTMDAVHSYQPRERKLENSRQASRLRIQPPEAPQRNASKASVQYRQRFVYTVRFLPHFSVPGQRREKLEILKDSHIGAFAVIMLVLYGLAFLSALSEVENRALQWCGTDGRSAACRTDTARGKDSRRSAPRPRGKSIAYISYPLLSTQTVALGFLNR